MKAEQATLDTIALAAIEIAIREFEARMDTIIDRHVRDIQIATLQAERATLEARLGCTCHPSQGDDR